MVTSLDVGWIIGIAGNGALVGAFLLERKKSRGDLQKREGEHSQIHERIEENIEVSSRRLTVLEMRQQSLEVSISRFEERQKASLAWLERIARKLDIP